MAKRKRVETPPAEPPNFEQSLQRLESIIRQLEDGQIGLSEALTLYEEAVGCLKQCHQRLNEAEARVVLLNKIDSSGQAITQPWEDAVASDASLTEKARSRGQRRTGRRPQPSEEEADADAGAARHVDSDNTLF